VNGECCPNNHKYCPNNAPSDACCPTNSTCGGNCGKPCCLP
jgi:hypothetical protein